MRALFHSIFDVVRLAVLVVISPGQFIRFPPVVMQKLLGTFFVGGSRQRCWNISPFGQQVFFVSPCGRGQKGSILL